LFKQIIGLLPDGVGAKKIFGEAAPRGGGGRGWKKVKFRGINKKF